MYERLSGVLRSHHPRLLEGLDALMHFETKPLLLLWQT